MEFDYENEALPLEIRYKIAWESNYKDLLNLCKTSRKVFGEICGDNWFWEQKTYYDFGDLYTIEEFEGNWWDTYQHYRAVFTLDLIEALEEQEPLLAKKLLRINEKKQFLMVDGHGEDGYTALMMASFMGYTDIVKTLLSIGADTNIISEGGLTALMEASYMDNTDIVDILLKAGADPNLTNEYGATALEGSGASENSAKIIRSYIES